MRRLSALFFASGFAGLIYESIWTHYLKLFLGHAAYAQALVLAIFMGGMAIGAGVAARYSARLRNPLLAYAFVEVAIGLLALSFHPVFLAVTERFYDVTLAGHSSAAGYTIAKWALGALLILPQSVLLGATFPLFGAAATRGTTSTGRSIATLYFANSIGGALGVLAAGFVLIPMLDLPGTIAAAGGINLLIGAIARRMSRTRVAPAPAAGAQPAPFGKIPLLLVAVSLLTGASSFIYEVGWIRMLSLVLGSATHAFELMLCAFIVGLALGGLWVRNRIDGAAHPGVFLGYIQIVMGAAAIATIPLYNASFDLTAWFLDSVPRSENGYALFNAMRYGISSLVMFPAAFCAGMTLPLATRILHSNEAQGERAIGVIYSANTVGAIIGLVLAVSIGFPVLGLEYLVASGALIDIALGIVLLGVFAGRAKLRLGLAALAASGAATVLAATTFNPQKLVSGVFRTGNATTQGTVLEIAHGRTATISVDQLEQKLFIRTNGKPDASAVIGVPFGYQLDEVTASLLAAFPMMLHEAPRRVANIGFGSGITSATLLADPRVQRLDTVEIEPRMIDLARHFNQWNDAAYTDPRSAIHIEDAKSFFASQRQRYDVIVSEPSNPWVSGIAGLFSVEFYRHMARYLEPDGLFVQWLQVYEIDPDRAASVIKALDQSFDDYLVLAANYADLVIVATPRGRVALPADSYSRLDPSIQQRLRRLGIGNRADVALRVVGNKALFKPWIDSRPVPANSDYAPYLDTHADQDRFAGRLWTDAALLAMSAYPTAEVLARRPAFPPGELPTVNRHFGDAPAALTARLARMELTDNEPREGNLPLPSQVPGPLARQGAQIVADCRNPPQGDKPYAIAGIAIKVLPFLSQRDALAVLGAAEGLPCFRDLPANQALWPALLRHVAARQVAEFGAVAQRLLEQGQGTTPARAQYLLGLALLGRLGQDDAAGARAIWLKHQEDLRGQRLNLGLEILAAHALSAPPRQRASAPFSAGGEVR